MAEVGERRNLVTYIVERATEVLAIQVAGASGRPQWSLSGKEFVAAMALGDMLGVVVPESVTRLQGDVFQLQLAAGAAVLAADKVAHGGAGEWDGRK